MGPVWAKRNGPGLVLMAMCGPPNRHRLFAKSATQISQIAWAAALQHKDSAEQEAVIMATLYLQHLDSDESELNKVIDITAEELDMLRSVKGFPDETHPWDEEMTPYMKAFLDGIYDRVEVFARPADAHLLIP